jgi:hypothetical protein
MALPCGVGLGAADGDAEDDAFGDDECDDEVVAVDVDVACDAAPFVAASATPVAPAPIPAARNAVKMKRRILPFAIDAICSLLSPGSATAGQSGLPQSACVARPAASRGAALSRL